MLLPISASVTALCLLHGEACEVGGEGGRGPRRVKDWREDDRKGEHGGKTTALERNERKGVGYGGS